MVVRVGPNAVQILVLRVVVVIVLIFILIVVLIQIPRFTLLPALVPQFGLPVGPPVP